MTPLILSISEIEKIALQVRPEIIKASLLVGVEAAELKRLKLMRFPVPELNFSYSRQVKVMGPDSTGYGAGVSASFVLWDWGKSRLRCKVQRLKLEMASMERKEIGERIKLEVRKRCVDILLAKSQLKVYRQLLDILQKQLSIEKEKLKLGSSTQLDVIEIEAEVKDVESKILSLENRLVRLLDSLKLYLFIERDIEVSGDLDREFLICPPTSVDSDSVIAMALKKSRQVLKARLAYKAALKNLTRLQRGYFPDLTLNFGYSLSGGTFPPRERNWNFSVSLDFSGLFGGVRPAPQMSGSPTSSTRGLASSLSFAPFYFVEGEAGLRKAYMEAIESFSEFRTSKKGLIIEVKSRLREIKSTWKLLEALDKKVEANRKRYEIYKVKHEIGEVRKVDFLEAQRKYFESMAERMKVKADYIFEVSQLELLATGRMGSFGIVKMSHEED